MRLFTKKTKEQKLPEPDLTYLPAEHKASIEIVAHKNAHAKAKEKVDEANEMLRQLFQDNHFSLTIYLATGGQVKQKRKPKT